MGNALLLFVNLPLVDGLVLQIFEKARLLVTSVSLKAKSSFVFVNFLVVQILIDHMLFDGHEMILGTDELGVLCFAVGAWNNFKLI